MRPKGRAERPWKARHGVSHEPLPRWDYVASGERLTSGLERELTARAQAGDEAARRRIVDANVPLVVSVARNYASARLEAEDLIQEGMIGLCTAIERFDPERGFRFSTYATYWIRQRILRALDRQGRMIRLPVDVACAARRAQEAREELHLELGREPTLAELAPACGVSERRLKAVLECLEEPVSLDAPADGDAGPLTLEVADDAAPDPEAALLRAETELEVEKLLEKLPERDRLVLEARFGLGDGSLPLPDLAARLRLTQDGVRQVQRRALLKLRRAAAGVVERPPAEAPGFTPPPRPGGRR